MGGAERVKRATIRGVLGVFSPENYDLNVISFFFPIFDIITVCFLSRVVFYDI